MRRLMPAILVAAKLFAQGQDTFIVSGEVQHDSSVDLTLLSVELIDVSSHLAVDRVMLSSMGDFRLRCPGSGNYEVSIVTRDRSILKKEFITISPHSGPLVLKLPESPANKAPSGSVSVAELSHKINPKAAREFSLAEKAKRKRREADMVEHLENAVRLDPDYAPPHQELAALFVNKRDYAMAAEQFKEVARICPGIPEVHTNLAIALLHLNQFPQAEVEARVALRLKPDDPKARYLMGVSLVGQHRMNPAELNKLSFK